MRRNAVWFGMLVLVLLVAGCAGPPAPPPRIELRDITFQWDPVASWMLGRAVNTGGSAQYIEIGVKVTPPGDPNYVIAKGWTNFVNVSPGANLPLQVVLTGGTPAGPYEYHWRWSTEVGKAMY